MLGIEFGSTRIKAVLIGDDHAPRATGAHDWENMLVDGSWTYSLDMIWEGISDCYSKMAQDAKEKYGVTTVSYTHLDVYKRQIETYKRK